MKMREKKKENQLPKEIKKNPVSHAASSRWTLQFENHTSAPSVVAQVADVDIGPNQAGKKRKSSWLGPD